MEVHRHLEVGKALPADLPRHSLQFLREVYGIEKNNAHRALDDVVVLYEVFQKMVDDLSYQQSSGFDERKERGRGRSRICLWQTSGTSLGKSA